MSEAAFENVTLAFKDHEVHIVHTLQFFQEVPQQQTLLFSHRDEMKNQHTVKNSLSSFWSGGFEPFIQCQYILTNNICVKEGNLKLKNSVKLAGLLIAHAELLSLLITVSIMFLHALVPACVYFCMLRETKTVTLKTQVFVSVPAAHY